jgi:alkanesulfonate monooxygenase SsuD/methylene tetrahydromethanopterin reductase-like flavin-dependent oxidoreductase (luciferase family)
MVMNGEERRFEELVELGVQAEAAGFDGVWVGDSILARPRFEPLTTLAAVAARTERITVGTAILLSALRSPVVLANEVANLDLIAGGRLLLGLGSAAANDANRAEFEAIGLPFKTRISRFEEGIEVMQRLWTGEEVNFSGRHFQLHAVRLGLRPYRDGRIPLWLSASEDNSLRRVLRLGDGWLILAPSPEAFQTAWTRMQDLAREEGRDVSSLARAVYVTLDIDEDVSAAEARMRLFVEGYYKGRYEELTRIHAVCAGPSHVCIAWLKDFLTAGANTLIVRFNQRDQSAQLERFAREVMPALRE